MHRHARSAGLKRRPRIDVDFFHIHLAVEIFVNQIGISHADRIPFAGRGHVAHVDQTDLRHSFPSGHQPASDDLRIHSRAADVFAHLVHNQEADIFKG